MCVKREPEFDEESDNNDIDVGDDEALVSLDVKFEMDLPDAEEDLSSKFFKRTN